MGRSRSVPIKITNSGTYPLGGTKLAIDGITIPELANVEFRHRAGKTALVVAEVHALAEVEIELPAEVQITVVAIHENDEIEIDRSRTDKVIYRVRSAPRPDSL